MLTRLADHGQVDARVWHQVAHRADVLCCHVGQQRNLAGGFVRINLREDDAAENAVGPIGSRIILGFPLLSIINSMIIFERIRQNIWNKTKNYRKL